MVNGERNRKPKPTGGRERSAAGSESGRTRLSPGTGPCPAGPQPPRAIPATSTATSHAIWSDQSQTGMTLPGLAAPGKSKHQPRLVTHDTRGDGDHVTLRQHALDTVPASDFGLAGRPFRGGLAAAWRTWVHRPSSAVNRV